MNNQLNSLKQQVTQTEDKLDDLSNQHQVVRESVDKIENQQYESQYEYATISQVDAKLQSLLEKLKVNNQVEWKQTVREAEKIFSEQGIKDQIELLPQHLQGVPELKQTINTIATDYVDDRKNGQLADENRSKPKPQINSVANPKKDADDK